MGRRKKPVRRLQIGAFYFIDRRVKAFQILRKVLSRQNSLNSSRDNLATFKVRQAPENNSLVVASQESFFGKSYCKIIVGNTQETLVGYVLVSRLNGLIQGKLRWVSDSMD